MYQKPRCAEPVCSIPLGPFALDARIEAMNTKLGLLIGIEPALGRCMTLARLTLAQSWSALGACFLVLACGTSHGIDDAGPAVDAGQIETDLR